MTTPKYVPLLKAKQGELRALKAAYPTALEGMTPLVEVVPWEVDESDSGQETRELELAVKRLTDGWPHHEHQLLLDASAAEPDPDDLADAAAYVPFLLRLLERLWEFGILAVPVVRVSDSELRIDRLAAAIEARECGAAVRITAEDLDDVVTPLRDSLDATVKRLRLEPAEVDVILDFGSLADDGAGALAARLARFVLPQLADQSWRTFALASGAFPENLGQIAPFTVGSLPRRDAGLWRALQPLQLPRQLDYGDYAVTHPLLPPGMPFAAPPQVRYTVAENWLALKGRRTDRRGHSQFYDLCATLLGHLGAEATPPEASWGDSYIHSAAATAGSPSPQPGPGNAAIWRAIGTSHHLAFVVNQLRERGEP